MRKLMLVLAAAALLGAAPAQAKELLGAQLCGPDGCVTQRSTLLLEGRNGPFDGELAAPAKPGDWYRGFLLAGERGQVVFKLAFYYVPGGNQVVQPGRGGQTTVWMHPDGKLASLIATLAERTKPYATPRVTSVTLNGKAVDDPQSYLRLWEVGNTATTYPDGTDSQQVTFYTDRASPWSDGNYVVAYAGSRLLVRDGQLVSLPKDVAGRVAAGRSLDTGPTVPWLWLPILGVIALAAVAALVARRLRPRPSPQPVTQA